MTNSPGRRALVCLAGLTLVAAGCGTSAKTSAASAGPTTAAAASGAAKPVKATGGGNFCKLMADSLNASRTASTGTTPADLEKSMKAARAMGDAAVGLAPSAIRGDVALLMHASDAMFDALDKAGYDYSKLSAADMSGLSSPQVAAAEKRITAYITDTCGIDLTAQAGAAGASAIAAAGAVASAAAGATAGPAASNAAVQPSAAPAATEAPAAAAGSACGLATLSQISTAAGKPMKLAGGGGPICVYASTADASFTFYVQVYSDTAAMATMKQLGSATDGNVTGLGDSAFWNPTAATLFVQRGSQGFSFSMPSLLNLTAPDPALKARMLTLGHLALAHL
jgi:hypothetical protein